MDILSENVLVWNVPQCTECQRPYHTEYTGSHQITEVKQCWAHTAKILPTLCANFTCVPVVHCKLPRTFACTTNILSLPRKVSWYDQYYCSVPIPNVFHGINSKDSHWYQDQFLAFHLDRICLSPVISNGYTEKNFSVVWCSTAL